jgi:lipopolysaccharide export system permease protein
VLQDNIIIAEKGRMHISDDKKFLEFDLENGWRYQEKGSYNTTATEFYRLGFKKYKKVFDLSSFNMMKTPDSLFKGSYNMLNVDQLNHSSDSIQKILTEIKYQRIPKEVNTYFTSAPIFMKGTDHVVSTATIPAKSKSYASLLPDSVKTMSYSKAADKINLVKNAHVSCCVA